MCRAMIFAETPYTRTMLAQVTFSGAHPFRLDPARVDLGWVDPGRANLCRAKPLPGLGSDDRPG